jgi:hypothetical protein
MIEGRSAEDVRISGLYNMSMGLQYKDVEQKEQ